MLIKNLEIRKHYTEGFDGDPSTIITEIYDLDRSTSIIGGVEVIDRIKAKLDGFILGMQLAGYSVNVERVLEVDETNGATRISVSEY